MTLLPNGLVRVDSIEGYWDFDEIDAIIYDALVEEGIIIDMGDVI